MPCLKGVKKGQGRANKTDGIYGVVNRSMEGGMDPTRCAM